MVDFSSMNVRDYQAAIKEGQESGTVYDYDVLIELEKQREKGKRVSIIRFLKVERKFQPEEVAPPEEIPPECGLMEVENGKVYFEIHAPTRDMCPPTWNFVASLTRYSRTRIQEVAAPPDDEVLHGMYRTLLTVVENFLDEKGPKWKLTHIVNTIKQHRANPGTKT